VDIEREGEREGVHAFTDAIRPTLATTGDLFLGDAKKTRDRAEDEHAGKESKVTLLG
jgi:hypothetical protein